MSHQKATLHMVIRVSPIVGFIPESFPENHIIGVRIAGIVGIAGIAQILLNSFFFYFFLFINTFGPIPTIPAIPDKYEAKNDKKS